VLGRERIVVGVGWGVRRIVSEVEMGQQYSKD
jgi:hypothetical protein